MSNTLSKINGYEIKDAVALQSTDVSVATGDKILIADSSDENKIARTSLSFDTSNTTSYLRKDGTWAVPAGGGGGGSYTATSPISIDSSNVISHDTSGVTAGTYVATDYDSSKLGSYDSIEFPTITVDSTGHITSASAYGKVLSKAINSSMASNQTGLMSYAEAYNLSYNLDFLFPHIYTDSAGLGFTITSGSSSKTVNMAVGYNQIASTSAASSSQKLLSPTLYSYRIVGIDAVLYNSTTKYEPVIVDWSATDVSYNSTGWTCTVTVSTGEAVPTGYTLYFKILYSPYVSM